VADPPTVIGWISTNNHKALGRRFVVTAFGFFIAAGLLAAAVRAQLAFPDNKLVGRISTTSSSPCTARR
jgi:cytochrome c oxidase subunit 1